MDAPDGYLFTVEAAKYLGIKPQTLALWVCYGRIEKPKKSGWKNMFLISELDRVNAEREKAKCAPKKKKPRFTQEQIDYVVKRYGS